MKAIESRNFEVLRLERGFALRFFLRARGSYWESKKSIRLTLLFLCNDNYNTKRLSRIEILNFYASREVSPYVSCSVHVKAIENRNPYPDNDCAEKLSKIEILNFHASWRAFVSSFFLCIPRIEIFEFLFILKRLSAFLSLRDDHRRLEVIESRNFESPRVAKNIYLNMFLTCSLAQREILIFHAYREDHSSFSAYMETRNFEFPRILNNDRLTFLSLCTRKIDTFEFPCFVMSIRLKFLCDDDHHVETIENWNFQFLCIMQERTLRFFLCLCGSYRESNFESWRVFGLRFFLRAYEKSILLHASWRTFVLRFFLCARGSYRGSKF